MDTRRGRRSAQGPLLQRGSLHARGPRYRGHERRTEIGLLIQERRWGWLIALIILSPFLIGPLLYSVIGPKNTK